MTLADQQERGNMRAIFEQLKGKLIVSCQAFPGDPLDDTDAIRRMALAALDGGAAGLRINSAEHVGVLRPETQLPIIGLHKHYGSSGLRITPDFASAAALAAAGASMIAVDCTPHVEPDGEPWQHLIGRIHNELDLPVMADIATLDEALAAEAAGADCVGPTLHGYTERTRNNQSFSWSLLAEMAARLRVPIMAEGHIATPAQARRAIQGGAWAVIAGSAITRPGSITAGFVRALREIASPAAAIGVDIGGTAVKAGLVLRNGEIGCLQQAPTDATRGRDAIAEALVRAVTPILAEAERTGRELAGIGIATAGAVDQSDGSIFAATDNLPGWAGFGLRSFAEEQFRLPVRVVNDAQAAALSELQFGGGRDLSSFAVITLGTGVGGGVVVNGSLLAGQHGFAGSIGHSVVQAGGRACNCGRHGCLEAYVSTAALIREYGERGGILDASAGEAAMATKINALARAGDAAAHDAYDRLGACLAEAIADLFNLIDPETVFLCGGLIEGYEPFVAAVEKRVAALLHFGSKRQPRVRAAHAGRLAGMQGAAALVFRLDD
jgi:predicted NBD/HSP70 family sugar kinase/putative N-acetylmannosamine-6-phosphate epimerase